MSLTTSEILRNSQRTLWLTIDGIKSAINVNTETAILAGHDVKNIEGALSNVAEMIYKISRDLDNLSQENAKLNKEYNRLKNYEASFDSVIFAITGTEAGQEVIDDVDVEILTKNAIDAVRQLESERLQAVRALNAPTPICEELPARPFDSAQACAIKAAAVYDAANDIKLVLLCAARLKGLQVEAAPLLGFLFSRADYYRRQAEGAL
ncbi:hypothetical protein [Acerihabitans arboris]|uniref:Uncharacterized protein n=1 Tax=Acerihabitans arboris TaxID=2691583 RepID=A0A845SN45_9GAMM|nr:hypothetical protein [Acerihabitans arboris]NDL64812.1 hypothetical protein [Acerihabitans arboris]